ncbi:NB-ARC domain-containing protein [Laspinema olomoucense]|uniref:NB-ARC domain-containing protein n=1 Tax=Laspinema olomoucense D3b TaxID=2953688 RepID=A0ABT2N5R8_9CYAN|nr:NB-ARC domain-containing protein [Laspinema sp. D3b]MCT7976626.1 NB-ARC domain-containing protein [Laspinema sp. D3b]
MLKSLKASTEGLAVADRARKRLGWTKTSTARWWQDAHTSRATLRRFWHGDRIQREIFIAICATLGISDWQAIAEQCEADFDPAIPESPAIRDWHEAPDLDSFFGRDRELAQLEQWIPTAKMLLISGMGGMGKTALALAFADSIQAEFQGVIWRSLHHYPSLIALLDSLLSTLERTSVTNLAKGTTQLLHHLKHRRYLLILDGLEAVLQSPELETEYTHFLQTLNGDRHQSCILLTSREQPQAVPLEGRTIRALTLLGLRNPAALDLLKSRGFTGKELGISALIQLYRGNPFALKIVTPVIQTVFGGNIAAFLNQNTLIIGDRLRTLLHQQLERLSDLEREILYWLAIWQEPVSFCRLHTHFLVLRDPAALLEGIASLERRSLLESWCGEESSAFTLQPLVMKSVRDELVERATAEMKRVVQSHDIRYFKVLRSLMLVRPGTDDIAGDQIINQLRENLWQIYGTTLPQTLHNVLALLPDKSPLAVGYIGCNAIALLQPLDL